MATDLADVVPRHRRADDVVSEFLEAKRRIELELARCDGEKDCNALDGLQEELRTLRRKITDAAGYLPGANLRWLQQEFKALKEAVGKTEGRVKPRSRFAFKNKGLPVVAENETRQSNSKEAKMPRPDVVCDRNAVGFRDRSDEELQIGDVDGKNVELASLFRCRVTIRASPAMLFVHRISHCEVRCGPTVTSVFVEDSKDCEFWVACQQLRIHGTQDCIFRMHVATRTVIEDSRGIRVGAYDWKYEGDEAHWIASGLDRSKNNWKAVDDFDRPVANEPSPNWSLLE